MACLQTNLLEVQAATCELKHTMHKALGSFLSEAHAQYPSLPYPARLLGSVQVSGQEITQKELRSMLQQVCKQSSKKFPTYTALSMHLSLHSKIQVLPPHLAQPLVPQRFPRNPQLLTPRSGLCQQHQSQFPRSKQPVMFNTSWQARLQEQLRPLAQQCCTDNRSSTGLRQVSPHLPCTASIYS